jgi:hypothetical protein
MNFCSGIGVATSVDTYEAYRITVMVQMQSETCT